MFAVCLLFSITSGCTAPFGSLAQQFAYYEMSGQMVRLHHENEASPMTSTYSVGVLAIFDTNGDAAKAEYTVRGETAEGAMYALLQAVQNPCAPDGPRPRIAAFAPSAAVKLPISFMQCSTLRDQVELLAAQTRALRGVLAANARNRKDLDQVAADVAKVSGVQEKSWARAIDMLKEMAGEVKKGEAK